MTHSDVRPPAELEQQYTPRAQTPPTAEHRDWNPAQRIGFRFALVYAILYTFPFPLSELPYLESLSKPYDAFWQKAVPWIGAHVLRLSHPINMQPSGSGDRLYNWVNVLGMAMLALAAAIVWTARARAKSHPRLLAGLIVYLRFSLAATIFGYGFDKIIPNQFEPMNPTRLVQYFGEAAPGGFAWFFLGSSVMYEVFAGIGETVAATLLLFRRTATLGALIGAAVMANVFMLNMSYDIPVKQFSFHLLIGCCAVAAYDAERLLNIFIRNRPAIPRPPVELLAGARARRWGAVAATLLMLWVTGRQVYGEWQGLKQYGRLARHGPIFGIFETEGVTKNGVPQPLLLNDATIWKRLATGNRGTSVRLATDSLVRYAMRADSLKHTVSFLNGPDTTKKMVFAYAFPDTNHLVLAGRMGSDSVEMRFRRRHMESFLLVNRGFHWVNEVPYFR